MLWRPFRAVLCVAALGAALIIAIGGSVTDSAMPLTTAVRAPRPVIDGQIRPGEWDQAAAIVGLSVLGQASLPMHPATAWITYDDTSIYIAARSRFPAGARPKATPRAHDGQVWEDDAIEMFIDATHGHGTYYQFIGNSAGTTWESQKLDGAWGCDWTYRASVADDHWDAEMAIPFAALGVTLRDGDVWGFNVAHDCHTPASEISTWAPVQNGLHEPERFGHLRFQSNGPSLQVTDFRVDGAAAAVGIAGRLLSPAEPLNLHATLARRTAAGEEHIADAPKAFERGAHDFSLTLPLPTSQDGAVVPGDYRVICDASAAGGATVARSPAAVSIPPPLALTVRKYFLSGMIEVQATANCLPGTQWPEQLNVQFGVCRRGVAAPLRNSNRPATPGRETAPVSFDISNLDAGAYEVRARLRDPQGKELAAVSEGFEKPEKPSWLGSREGISDDVLPPWTPLKVSGTSVSPWGRRYDFAGLPLPAHVVTAGTDVLAAPIRLVAVVGGQAQTWRAGEANVKLRSKAAVELTTETRSERLDLSGTVRVEYDGVVRSDLRLAPRGPVSLDSLALEIPLKEQNARYLYHFPGQWGSAYNAGGLAATGWTGPFRPFIWLGDEDRGLSWFCESERNWWPADPNAVTETIRQNGIVLVRLHIIDQPQQLTAPLDYTFGFEATPVKPTTETVWDYRICHAGGYGIEDQPYRPDARLTYPAEGNINLDRGTLEMWVRVEFDPNVKLDPNVSPGIYNRSLFLLALPDGDAVGFYWNIDDRGMRFYVKKGAEYPIVFGSRSEWHRGELHHVALTWGDQARIYVDGELRAQHDWHGLTLGDLSRATLVFGGSDCDFAIDEIRISDIPRPPQDFAREYQPDDDTLLLDHLNDAFEPDGTTRTHAAKGAFAAGDTGGLVSPGARFAPVKFGNGLELYPTARTAKTCLDALSDLGVRTICFHEHWTDIQNYTSTTHGEALHRLVKACHARGIRLLLYFGYEMSDIAPEWPLYSDECLVYPRAGGYHRLPEQHAYIVCYNSPWQDFMADGIARMMDEYDIDGVYLDGTANPWACANVHHGCGYTRPDGTTGPTYGIFAAREMMRRIYTIVKTRKPNGLVNVHQSTCMTIPSVGWATSYWDGEQFGGIERGPFALDVLPLDAFRCEFMGRQWGVPAEFLCYERPYTYDQATAFTLLHDVLVRGSGLGPNLERESLLWHIMDDFGREQAQWLPYWANADYVTAAPDGVKVSIYSRGARGALLVVSNLSSASAEARVRLSLPELGLPAWAAARDMITQENVPLRDGAMTLAMEPLAYRVIAVK